MRRFTNRPPVRIALLLLIATLGACSADAQPGRRSQRATVTQVVNGTELSIRYYRPSLRGRTPFPDVVNWGRTWTPGADSATRIETSGDIEVEGSKLPAGKYSLWLIPLEKEDWTLIFSRAHTAFHLPYPDGQDALRVHVHPTTGSQMESLALYFPVVDADSAVMNVHWGTTVVPVRIRAR